MSDLRYSSGVPSPALRSSVRYSSSDLNCERTLLIWRSAADVILGLRHLELHLLRFLNEDLFVNEIIENERANDRSCWEESVGTFSPLCAPLIDGGEHIGPEKRLFADDRDNAVDRKRSWDTT